jgi:hypothetical protein
VQRRGEGYQDLSSMWRVQLFNYIAFTVALVSLAARNQLSSFNRLAALHLTYMYLVSALTGSLLVHPTYFNRPSTRQRAWHTVAVSFIRIIGGLLPAAVCAWSGGPPNCINFYGQIQETENFVWIVLFAMPVGRKTAYALILTFAGIVLLLHVTLSLNAIPKAIQRTSSRFLAVNRRKQTMNDLVFVVFFIYWIEATVAIERSLVVNFGSNVKAQNNWGFGQVSTIIHIASMAPYTLFQDPIICITIPCFGGALVECLVPNVGSCQSYVM